MKKIVAIILILSLAFGQTIYASALINDVPNTHWAFTSVRAMVDAGHMTLTGAGDFRPDAPIDKFETSRILARAAGASQTLMNEAYANHGATIAARSSTYSRWNESANREIAFLMSRGIYTEYDLGNFIVRTGDAESLRALSRQEAAVYLVRLMGRGGEAANFSFTPDFSDDARITANFRPYVYFLRSLGVISGEPGNNFNPNGAVSRAAMAVLLQRSLGMSTAVQTGASGASDVTAPVAGGTVVIDSISGNIERVHANINALQLRLSGGEIRIMGLIQQPNIFVDGQRRTIHNLEEGMQIVGITRDGSIIDLQAQSLQAGGNLAASTAQGSEAAVAPPPAAVSGNYRTVQGTVSALPQGAVVIEIRMLNPHGFIITDNETFTVDANTTFRRGTQAVALSDISVNDVISARVSGARALSLELEERERRVNATVIDRRTESVMGTNYFVLEDAQGNTHELVVNDATVLRRAGITGNARFNDIRIGDTIDLIARYSQIIEAYAYGSRGSAEGIISEIHITRNGTSVVLIDSSGEALRYHAIAGAFDVHTLRLNSRVSLRLDSREIEGFIVLPML